MRQNRLRIAHVRCGEQIGGAERIMRDLAVHIDRSRFDLAFFFLACGGPYIAELLALGYPVFIIPARSGYNIRLRWQLAQLLRGFQPDLVHDHGVPPFIRPITKWATGAHLVSTEHGEIEINRRKHKPWLNWLKGIEYRLYCETVLVNSTANCRLVTNTHHLKKTKVRLIHNGVDLTEFKFRPTPPDQDDRKTLSLGYVGRLETYDKGVDFLPYIAHRLIDRGFSSFHLKIVGDGPARQLIQATVARLGLSNWIEILGQRSDIPELMANMDILIVPSRYEAFGLTAVESLAVGTRVAAFAVGGLAEILADCEEARLVTPGDINAMAETIKSMWLDFGKQRSKRCHQYVKERYDIQITTRKVEELYSEIIESSE